MPSPRRRRVLRASAAALTTIGLTGCLGGDDADGDSTRDTTAIDESEPTETTPRTRRETTSEPPPDSTETTSEASEESFALPESTVKPVADARVGVADPVRRSAVAYESIMGSGGVLAPGGEQFVVAAVQSATDSTPGATGPPSYDAFDLVAGGERYPAVEIEKQTKGAFTTSLADRGDVKYDDPYADGLDGGVGWVAFRLPSPLTAKSPTVRCRYGGESATWSLPEDVATALGREPPRFELRSFAATRTDAGVELSLTVENATENAGEFLAAVYWPTSIADDDESRIVREQVAANGRVDWSTTVSPKYAASSDGEVTASVEGRVSGTATVSLPEATTSRSN